MRIAICLVAVASTLALDDAAMKKMQDEGGHAYDTLDGIDRYIRFDAQPKPTDKDRALEAGGDLRCVVCENILLDVVQTVSRRRRPDADSIAEALEADFIDEDKIESAPTDMLKHVEKKKRGCNRLFKENYLAKGLDAEGCFKLRDGQEENVPYYMKASFTCFKRHENYTRNDTLLNTYSVKSEAIFYACESTVSKYREELAEFIAIRLKKESALVADTEALSKLTAEACKKKAKCEPKYKLQEEIKRRSTRSQKQYESRGTDALAEVIRKDKEQKRAEKQKAKKEAAAKKEAKRKGAEL